MKSEAQLLNELRLNATRKGMRLWRNNVGAAYMQDGSFIRYGLANDSAAVNKVIKSSDLIGIKPVIITSDMIGKKIGQFVSREVKSQSWVYRGTERERAQKAWIDLINSFGGDASFINSEDDL